MQPGTSAGLLADRRKACVFRHIRFAPRATAFRPPGSRQTLVRRLPVAANCRFQVQSSLRITDRTTPWITRSARGYSSGYAGFPALRNQRPLSRTSRFKVLSPSIGVATICPSRGAGAGAGSIGTMPPFRTPAAFLEPPPSSRSRRIATDSQQETARHRPETEQGLVKRRRAIRGQAAILDRRTGWNVAVDWQSVEHRRARRGGSRFAHDVDMPQATPGAAGMAFRLKSPQMTGGTAITADAKGAPDLRNRRGAAVAAPECDNEFVDFALSSGEIRAAGICTIFAGVDEVIGEPEPDPCTVFNKY